MDERLVLEGRNRVLCRLHMGLQLGANGMYAREKGLITASQYAVLQQVCCCTMPVPWSHFGCMRRHLYSMFDGMS